MADRPNFLIIITDQHRADHVGFGGNPVVQTPHLDALAARGMQFNRAIVSNPICMPNRSTIFTGRMPSAHGTRYNGIALDPAANTFPRILRQRGYRTAYVGKLHLQSIGNHPEFVDGIFNGQPAQDATQPPYPDGWDTWEDIERHRHEYVEMPKDFYGLDEIDLVIDHSDECGGHYYQWLLEQGVDPKTIQGMSNAQPYDALSPQVWKTSTPVELYPTSYITMRTVELLKRLAATPDEPFVAFCSYPDPHHPFTPPGEYFDRYDPNDIPLPATFNDPHEDAPKHFARMLDHRGSQIFRMAPFAPTAEQLRECLAADYGMISMIDDGVGEVLHTLQQTGLADNTVVIFTSDHGDMFGDHGFMLKVGMHYDGCIRVPLVIDAPGKDAGVCSSLVSSLDLAQTVLDLADCDGYYGMQGASLAPLLNEPTASVRDHVLVEEDEMFDSLGVGSPLRMRTLVTDDARLTLYHGTEYGELFDLQADADELNNIYGKAEGAGLRALLTEQLAYRLMQYADGSRKPTCLF